MAVKVQGYLDGGVAQQGADHLGVRAFFHEPRSERVARGMNVELAGDPRLQGQGSESPPDVPFVQHRARFRTENEGAPGILGFEPRERLKGSPVQGDLPFAVGGLRGANRLLRLEGGILVAVFRAVGSLANGDLLAVEIDVPPGQGAGLPL